MALDLGKQVGPLPLGAWIIVVGAGVGIAYTSRNSGGGTSPAATTDGYADYVEDVGTTPGVGEGPGWVSVTPPTSGASTTPTTNEEWGNKAVDLLIASGYDPSLVYSAIGKAVNNSGQGMSVAEYAVWRAALRALGSPPQLIDVPIPTPGGDSASGGGGAIITEPPPAPNVPPTPAPPPRPEYIYHVIKSGNSLRQLSTKYYGVEAGWNNILENNKKGTTRRDGSKGFIPGNYGGNMALNQDFPGRTLIIPRGGAGGSLTNAYG